MFVAAAGNRGCPRNEEKDRLDGVKLGASWRLGNVGLLSENPPLGLTLVGRLDFDTAALSALRMRFSSSESEARSSVSYSAIVFHPAGGRSAILTCLLRL